MIIKYQLENIATTSNSEPGLTTPECIDDGGYFYDIEDGTLIGYSDGTQPLCASCAEITEVKLEARRLRINNTHECAIRSNGQFSYVEALEDDVKGFMVAKAYPSNITAHYYKRGDSSCGFYSERPEGRKKYWSVNIPAEKYSQPDSDSKVLVGYSEIVGAAQEWYYEFTTFESMMSFVNSHKPITLNPALEVKMKDNPISVRPAAISDSTFMYLASLEITASGDKTTTIYVNGQPENVFS